MSDMPRSGTCYPYLRLSRHDARTGSCSLQWQRDTVLAWAERAGVRLAEPIEDNGVSGYTRVETRPQGKDLLARAKAPGDVVVVAKLDRLSRNTEDFLRNVRRWRAAGIRLVSATESIDLDTPHGVLMATMIVAFSECERSTIKAREDAARQTRKAHSLRSSTAAPYGWRHVEFGGPRQNGRREARLEVDRTEQQVIHRIVAMHGRCQGYGAIAIALTRDHVPTRKGAAWARSTVADIVREHREAPPCRHGYLRSEQCLYGCRTDDDYRGVHDA